MATNVVQSYTPSLNTSVTTRDGRIDKVVLWTTGVSGSTKVVAETKFRRTKFKR